MVERVIPALALAKSQDRFQKEALFPEDDPGSAAPPPSGMTATCQRS